VGDATSLSAWQARHTAQLESPDRGRSELVVLGDSLAEGWCASRSFQKQWGRRRPLNLGLSLDQTRQVLWRIENGSLQGVSARVVIVALGMDTLGAGYSADETARGIRAVVERVRSELPRAAILVLGVLPAGELETDPRRHAIVATNAALQGLAEPDRVVVADVGNMFLDGQGKLSESVMSDFVHPTPLGYDALTMSASLLAEDLLRSAKLR
jgi:lysophospholipase L1-like esterase